MELETPPTTPTRAPTTRKKVPGRQSSSLAVRAEGASLHNPGPRPPRLPSTSSTSTTRPSPTPRTPQPPSRSSRWQKGTKLVPHLLTFQEQGPQRDDPPEPTPTYTPDQKAYKCYWHKGTPLSARAGIHVHLVHHLSIPERLSVYEVVGDGWQLNVINAHVPFSNATEPFLQALAEAYRYMNAALTAADRGGQATPQDHAVRDTIEMLGLVDMTANLEGQPSHFPHQTEAAPSRIEVCYGDPSTVIRAEARYGPLPLGPTGHRPLQMRLNIPNLPPSPQEDADQGYHPT